jgi:glucose-1-phosphate adenylyltransferase
VTGSVLAPRVKVHSYATIVDSVVLDAVEVGRYATIRRAIIDKYTVIQEHAKIGIDHEHDRARGFHVSDNGVVVVPRDSVVTP